VTKNRIMISFHLRFGVKNFLEFQGGGVKKPHNGCLEER
jgi:hypothetical protein